MQAGHAMLRPFLRKGHAETRMKSPYQQYEVQYCAILCTIFIVIKCNTTCNLMHNIFYNILLFKIFLQ